MSRVFENVRTRWGVIDLIEVDDRNCVFAIIVDDPVLVDARAQHRARRCAVAWMANNMKAHSGVERYRFDILHGGERIIDAF